MQYRRLGRTGLEVSVLSLGSGGENRFGQSRYISRKGIRELVRQALDLGINFFDTASAYEQSESLLGESLRGLPRDRYHLATKVLPLSDNGIVTPAQVRLRVERSLQRLGVEALDILQLHRVAPDSYVQVRDRLMPELQKLRTEGKARYIGITEASRRDCEHRMLACALRDDLFDTVMVAYNLAHSSAENEVFPLARAHDVGVIGMTAARQLVFRSPLARLKLLSRVLAGLFASPPGRYRLKARLQEGLAALCQPPPGQIFPVTRREGGKPLELPSAAYTFAAAQPALATVLTGTTNTAHLEQNVLAALAPALTPDEIEQLRACVACR